ncbi:MAG TPA: ABC transporter substrate-binding protein [Gemmatimonadales bacterium]|nr:ABC transporter substrate-binding protein [Gemmatimonadales bacterium]
MTARRAAPLACVLLAALVPPALPQSRDRGTVVVVTGQYPTSPVPTTMEGPQATTANQELSDQLFLRLANLGPDRRTADERTFLPALARAWERRDSLTLVLELDPRARWQDGQPVVAEDVVFTFSRARDPATAPKVANLLRHVASVSADGDRRVVVRFSRAYPEQFYDLTFHVAPLPAHLLRKAGGEIPREFIANPVGSGPYRVVRTVPGQFIELAANPEFLLGAPRVRRVLVRVAADPQARLNLMLTGEADVMDNIPAPLSNIARVAATPHLRAVPLASSSMGYLLFNQRDRADRTRPHPVLADSVVRRAIRLALDRQTIVQAVFGRYAVVPYGPVSQLLWIHAGSPRPARQDAARARRLLAARGWLDHDGDGVLDRDGRPLSLTLSYPLTSEIRREIALQVQEQLRQVGVRIELVRLEGAVWNERRTRGDFDIDFSAVVQDPTPSGLTQGWTCAGGTNVAKYCNPRVDSLLDVAIANPGGSAAWQAVLQRIEADVPAVFMYAPMSVMAVSRRLRDVKLRPESPLLFLWEWLAG